MAYTRTNWVDRLVQFANRFLKSNETSTSVTLTADPGTVTQAGTPLSAANFNKMEQGIYDAHVTADGALQRSGGAMTGDLGLLGTGTNQFKNGNGDAASYATHNFKLKGWNGMGMSTYDDTVNGYYDFRLGKWDVKDGYYVNGIKNAQTRTTNGYLEWNNGGTWLPVGDIQVGRPRAASGSTNGIANTYATILNITGVKGRVEYITASITGTGGSTPTIRVTIDGVSETYSTYLEGSGVYIRYLDATSEKATAPIYFYSSFKVEFMNSDPNYLNGTVIYRLANGTA
ncbi:hypothetical protein [Paenibacillus sedimenti]|uniref:Uncharacterized protein n=1 Tax=Paenibacillus sedimenti TaxID=2770274 RepID=A0A926KS58_9BACL|nr:hypothetical protein [Paenibacillus sedimenti]MBD0381278.1 hypothetical protein [Paenibacillus sedimenti]